MGWIRLRNLLNQLNLETIVEKKRRSTIKASSCRYTYACITRNQTLDACVVSLGVIMGVIVKLLSFYFLYLKRQKCMYSFEKLFVWDFFGISTSN